MCCFIIVLVDYEDTIAKRLNIFPYVANLLLSVINIFHNACIILVFNWCLQPTIPRQIWSFRACKCGKFGSYCWSRSHVHNNLTCSEYIYKCILYNSQSQLPITQHKNSIRVAILYVLAYMSILLIVNSLVNNVLTYIIVICFIIICMLHIDTKFCIILEWIWIWTRFYLVSTQQTIFYTIINTHSVHLY